jgi:hypothetical protein
LIENSAGKLASDGGEAFEELVEGVIVFEVFEKCFDWDADAAEDGGADEDIGIDGDEVEFVHQRYLNGFLRKSVYPDQVV